MPPAASRQRPLAVLVALDGQSPAVAAVLEAAGFEVEVCRTPDEARSHCRGASVCDAALAEAIEIQEQSMEQLIRARLGALLDRLGQQPIGGLHALVMQQVERGLLRLVLERCHGHRGRAADQLGLHRNTLRQKLADLGLEEEEAAKRPSRRPRRKPRSDRARR